ncbi:hypothetical protein EVJ58_g6642 [Rhodofomes roseus]|uniref:Uncharacterized protein n=1 Tax=Rhodofomes roseus TaxID=34475 RepID=A0A4Y9Y6B9_9APHY|nr:hypothetical protein EVJ58_g6642 [Rhodofomes roseus]
MPASTQYEVLLDFTNDTHDCATVQLLRNYGRNSGAIVLLHPGESITLVLDAGQSHYDGYGMVADARRRLGLSIRTKDTVEGCERNLFPSGSHTISQTSSDPRRPVHGITVDRLWRDMRFCMWNDS